MKDCYTANSQETDVHFEHSESRVEKNLSERVNMSSYLLLPSWLFSGHAALFATLIAKTAKDIDFLIDSLPSKECSPELQVCAMFLLCCTCNYVKIPKNQLIRCIHNT